MQVGDNKGVFTFRAGNGMNALRVRDAFYHIYYYSKFNSRGLVIIAVSSLGRTIKELK